MLSDPVLSHQLTKTVMLSIQLKIIIAREWLYLIAGLVGGLFFVPLFLYFISDGAETKYSLGDWYREIIESLFTGSSSDFYLAWLLILAPYLLAQFIRSLMWAYKTIKNK